MFRYVRGENVSAGWTNPDPVAMVKTVTAHTSRHVTDYILCAECEDRFNKNGESWIAQHVWKGGDFPLLNRLNVAHPEFPFQDAIAFSGTAVGIDVDQLGYFALSVFWRAAVHIWSVGFGQRSTKLNLGSVEEGIRLHLLGRGPVPEDVTGIATICTDKASMGMITTPGRRHGSPVNLSAYGMTTLGLNFGLFIGKIQPGLRNLCCFHSPKRIVFMRNCERDALDSFAHLFETSKVAVGVKANIRKSYQQPEE